MGKHAYLIMAHNAEDLLCKLLMCLDDERNDLYLHIDRKAEFSGKFLETVYKSRLILCDSICVTWGGESQIEATLLLLKKSTSMGHYDYYHLISGQDYLLKTQNEIHNFFDSHQGLEFISCRKLSGKFMERIKFFYPFQDKFSRNSILGKIVRRTTVFIQKLLRIDRTRNAYKEYGIGALWFSITDKMARYVLSQEEEIRKHFFRGFCADEIYLQTIWLNSPFYREELRYHSGKKNHPFIQETNFDIMRAIDWTRGARSSPYTYTASDYGMLMESECLFVRKVDMEESGELLTLLDAEIFATTNQQTRG